MTDQHPITPPPELVKQWEDDWFHCHEKANVSLIKAYQAGADQELEACIELLKADGYKALAWNLRVARRPKPPKGPTDDELLEAAAKALGYKSIPSDETFLTAEAVELLAFARAVLARWGNYPVKPDSSPANNTGEEN
jgi:hypothetical protein